ncbi:MAG: glycosyltransferase family protein [Verrucomicrobiota bacterium]
MKTVAIVQARSNSTRLPRKIFLPLGTRSVLGHVIVRLQACARIDEVIVATTDRDCDDAVCEEAVHWNVKIFRGSENDVLARYYFAAREHQAKTIVRVTADCPLIEPKLIDEMIVAFELSKQSPQQIDFFANSLVKTFQHGLDAEIFTFAALDRAFQEATSVRDREHVSPFMRDPKNKFRTHNFASPVDFSTHRWTLDTPQDYDFLRKIFNALDRGPVFSATAVLKFLEQSGLMEQSSIYKPGTRELKSTTVGKS